MERQPTHEEFEQAWTLGPAEHALLLKMPFAERYCLLSQVPKNRYTRTQFREQGESA